MFNVGFNYVGKIFFEQVNFASDFQLIFLLGLCAVIFNT